MNIKYNLIKKLYVSNSFTRKLATNYIKRFEGDEYYSKSLRQIYKENYNMEVGFGSYGCFFPNFNFGQPMIIGNYCSFASGIQFIPGNHPISDVSTHPFFFRLEFGFVESRVDNELLKPTIVGHDVWIGRNVNVLPNCKKIGNGAIIGAGSVVTKDVEPYSIVAGNPARKIKMRFTEKEIELLENSKWYEKEPYEIKEAFKFANNIEMFINCIK